MTTLRPNGSEAFFPAINHTSHNGLQADIEMIAQPLNVLEIWISRQQRIEQIERHQSVDSELIGLRFLPEITFVVSRFAHALSLADKAVCAGKLVAFHQELSKFVPGVIHAVYWPGLSSLCEPVGEFTNEVQILYQGTELHGVKL